MIPYKAKFNLKYCVTVSILDRKCGLEHFTVKKLKDERVWKLIEKMRVSVNLELDRQYPDKWPSIVSIKTPRGTLSKRVDYPKGDPRNPFSRKEAKEKFLLLSSRVIEEEKCKEIVEKVLNFDKLSSIKILMDLIS